MIIPITDTFTLVTVYILTGVLGLAVGSFLNVVIYRLPRGMSLASPPSHCTSCDYRLKWYDNIPLLSYTLLRGRCRKCGAHISFRYTAVELANTVLWLLCAWRFAETSIIYAVLAMIVCSCCICVFFIDAETMIINDRFVIIIAVCGIISVFCEPSHDWLSRLIGGAAGFAVFYAIALIGSRIYGRDAMGGGDIKLAGAAGLMLGWQKLLLMLLVASVVGSIIMLSTRKKADAEDIEGNADLREMAFGPYLTASMALTLIFGDSVLQLYLSLILKG